MNRRVVVTGMGGLCPLGSDWSQVRQKFVDGVSGVALKPEWEEIQGLKTRLVAEVQGFKKPKHYPRQKVRSMGRVSLLATRATELALQDAGLLDEALLQSGKVGICYGSGSGSPPAIETYAQQVGVYRTLHGITASQFVRLMSHTTAANLAQFFGTTGRVVPTCSACTSGSQAIGFAYEMIKWGLQDVMVAGGAEESHVIETAVFDVLGATSTRHDSPTQTPRPFDVDRDGLVLGEGAATLVLETLAHAQARGARIYGELAGYATNCDGGHIVNPGVERMEQVQREALADAGMEPEDIAYINLHGTGTEVGDLSEAEATSRIFADRVPASTFKGHMGHTLGACGAIEAWLGLCLMLEGKMAPTLNLENLDPRCAPLQHVTRWGDLPFTSFISNNFAFGGVNTSLIFKAM